MKAHVLYRIAPHSDRIAPLLNQNEEVHNITQKNHAFGIILFDSSPDERNTTELAFRNIYDLDSNDKLIWVEIGPKHPKDY
jgi:hypothetical protein